MIYRSVYLYRFVMEVLYRGCYRKRFAAVFQLLQNTDGRVLELCFGDVYVAEMCRQNNVAWMGLDMSPAFVARARRKGYEAHVADLLNNDPLPLCDVCVMMGSLYHFESVLCALLCRIKNASQRLIISEPIQNWTTCGGIRGRLALAFTHAEHRVQPFRFTEVTLLQALTQLQPKVGFDFHVKSVSRDMIVEVIWLK